MLEVAVQKKGKLGQKASGDKFMGLDSVLAVLPEAHKAGYEAVHERRKAALQGESTMTAAQVALDQVEVCPDDLEPLFDSKVDHWGDTLDIGDELTVADGDAGGKLLVTAMRDVQPVRRGHAASTTTR